MSMDPYSERVRELFADPAHVGDQQDGNSVSADDQGIRVRLSATLDQGNLKALRFRVSGCPIVIAACELFCSSY